MKAAGVLLANLNQDDINLLELQGFTEFLVDNEMITINLNEVEVISEDIPGWLVANQDNLTVALDITVTDHLQQEGNARELVNRIQKLRKDTNLKVTDRIDVSIEKQEVINLSVVNFKDYICAEILADKLELVDSLKDGVFIDVNDLPVKIIINLKN
jgi:isoleucyl-tRNA synthetase